MSWFCLFYQGSLEIDLSTKFSNSDKIKKVKFVLIKKPFSGLAKAPITPISMTAGESARTSQNLVEMYVQPGFDAVKKSKFGG